MKIRICSHKEDITKIMPNETHVHFAFRPSNKDIFTLVETCPKLELIQIPRSYLTKLSTSIQQFLRMQRVEIKEGDVWGNRSDLSEYCEIPA